MTISSIVISEIEKKNIDEFEIAALYCTKETSRNFEQHFGAHILPLQVYLSTFKIGTCVSEFFAFYFIWKINLEISLRVDQHLLGIDLKHFVSELRHAPEAILNIS